MCNNTNIKKLCSLDSKDEIQNFELNRLKGKIAEEIAKFHFEQMNFKVIKTGKEELFKELVKLENENKFENSNVFKIYKKIFSKLPDFLIYEKINRKKMFFVEVKFRKKLSLEKYKNKKNNYEYIFPIFKDHNKNNKLINKLDILKYIDSLDNLIRTWPEFYVYLIANNNIYFGRIYKNDKNRKNGNIGDYSLKLLTPEGVENKHGKNWPKYRKIAEIIKTEILN